MASICCGLKPEQMEDKWFVYWEDQTLFLHRSWTGHCIYAARFEPQEGEGGNWRCTDFDVNRDSQQYNSHCDDADMKMLSYLIDVLLLRRESSFPKAGDGGRASAALRTWSSVGRAALGKHPARSDDK